MTRPEDRPVSMGDVRDAIAAQAPGMAAEDCPVRDVLDRLGDAWTLLVVLNLGERAVRFGALRRAIAGISKRMLSVTLRNLERDGLVSRRVIPATPPQVEYALTELGRSLAGPIHALTNWAAAHHTAVKAARAAYDQSEPRLSDLPDRAIALREEKDTGDNEGIGSR
jgi:DNA-binding HxlR family transcriptional regulator